MRNKLLLALCGVVALMLAAASFTLVLLLLPPRQPSGPPIDGCSRVDTTHEFFVADRYNCPDGTIVVTFSRKDGKDQYRQTVEIFGGRVVAVGDNWMRVQGWA